MATASSSKPCAECGTPTTLRCSKCKSINVCSKTCFKASWPAHKQDCKELAEEDQKSAAPAPTKKAIPRKDRPKLQVEQLPLMDRKPLKPLPEPNPQFNMAWSDTMALRKFQEAAGEIFQTYGTPNLPSKGCKMPAELKIQCLLDIMLLYDAGAEKNRDMSSQVHLFLNCQYNDVYKHALDNLTPSELSRLNAQMRMRKIGPARD